MKLLICTQAIDKNDALGFFHEWVAEFAKHFEHVHVICLKEGEHDLPANVTVHSLGKERGASRWQNIKTFYAHAWRLRHEYDTVFVHMNVEYVIMGGLMWRLLGKRVGQWYVHGTVSFRLVLACLLANIVCTTSQEGMRVPTRKKKVVGHGIDTVKFSPGDTGMPTHERGLIRIISNNRISPAKREVEMFEVCEELYSRGILFHMTFVGAPATDKDNDYEARLLERISASMCREHITYRGPIPHEKLPELIRRQDVALNLYLNSSLDKAGLEAMASGVRLVSTNIAFKDILTPDNLYLDHFDVVKAADAVVRAYGTDPERYISYVRHQHSLPALITRVTTLLVQR